MVDWHERLVDGWLDRLSQENLAGRVAQAARIDEIRGFGPVRAAAAARVRAALRRGLIRAG
ncbi:MAG: hypothetical protein R3E83_00355 [Burkholderiaceae bacterium]